MVSPFIMPYFYGKKLSGGGGFRISLWPVEAQKVYFIAYFECSSTSNCLV